MTWRSQSLGQRVTRSCYHRQCTFTTLQMPDPTHFWIIIAHPISVQQRFWIRKSMQKVSINPFHMRHCWNVRYLRPHPITSSHLQFIQNMLQICKAVCIRESTPRQSTIDAHVTLINPVQPAKKQRPLSKPCHLFLSSSSLISLLLRSLLTLADHSSLTSRISQFSVSTTLNRLG